jgi:DNA repair exonuclease SbcCD ATPase subunit
LATDSAHALDIDDWAEIFGFGGVLRDLAEGRAYPAAFRDRLDEARQRYPGVPLDYFGPLAAMEGYVGQIESAIAEQNATLVTLNRALGEVGLDFAWEQDRLLTETERAAIAGHLEWVNELIEEQRSSREEQLSEMDELRAELDELESSIGDVNDEIETITAEIAELEAEDDG